MHNLRSEKFFKAVLTLTHLLILLTSSIILHQNMIGHGDLGGLGGSAEGRVEDTAHPDDQSHDALRIKPDLSLVFVASTDAKKKPRIAVLVCKFYISIT